MNPPKSVIKTIEDYSLLLEGSVIVLGLSGGPDSLCLFDILYGLQEKYKFYLTALHFNHCVRGAEADADQEFLEKLCKERGVVLKVVKEDIPAMARSLGISVEDCGRRERHKALNEFCDEIASAWNGHPELVPYGAAEEVKKNAKDYEVHPQVALAHNADDQAETVLLRIIRGTGVHGLAAMSALREDGLIRPLLNTSRSEIEKYCKDAGLEPRIDNTNLETDYLRNKIRLEILPSLEQINPNVKASLTRLAESASKDDSYLNMETQIWIANHPGKCENGLLIRDLRGLAGAIFQRVIKFKFAEIGLKEDISAVHIDALEKAVYTNAGNKTIEFPKGFSAYINHGELIFRKPE